MIFQSRIKFKIFNNKVIVIVIVIAIQIIINKNLYFLKSKIHIPKQSKAKKYLGS